MTPQTHGAHSWGCRVGRPRHPPSAATGCIDYVPPLPLWKRLYLLCTRPDGLIAEYDELGALVRAGVLAELYLTGEVADRKAARSSSPPRCFRARWSNI